MLESASTDPRLAYNYATTEDGDADVDQGRKVQERTLRVMRFSLFLGLLVVAVRPPAGLLIVVQRAHSASADRC